MRHPFWAELQATVGERAYRIFSLRKIDGWGVVRIARAMGIHRGNVWRTVNRVAQAGRELARLMGITNPKDILSPAFRAAAA